MRKFDSGATRNDDSNQYDYEGFLSPLVMREFGKYMHEHRVQADGTLRDSDNWQKGIPKEAYMKSGFRHFHDWWTEHRGYESREGMIKALMGLLFNVQGYAHEILKGSDEPNLNQTLPYVRFSPEEKRGNPSLAHRIICPDPDNCDSDFHGHPGTTGE